MRKPFDNWLAVCRFTFLQRVKRPKFIIVTVLIAVILLAAVSVPILISAVSSDDGEEENPYLEEVTELVFRNATEYPADVSALSESFAETATLAGMTVREVSGGNEELSELAGKTEKTLALSLAETDDGFELTVILPYETDISEDTATEVGNAFAACLKSEMLLESGVDTMVIIQSELTVTGQTATTDEDTSFAASILKMLLPIVFGLFLYMMLLLYGQDLCNEVSSEKTSKLMETMLTSVHPYALVLGKVTAVFFVAVLQCLIWIGCLLAAVFGGTFIADRLYGENASTVTMAVGFVREHIGQSAFSAGSIILALVIFVLGILLYFSLAAIAGGLISRPEDTASVTPIFIWPIMICWIIPYFASLMEKEELLKVCVYIPFTAPFCLPMELLIGQETVSTGLISCGLMLIAAGLLIRLSAKLYRGMVLYIGQKFSWKTVWGVLREK